MFPLVSTDEAVSEAVLGPLAAAGVAGAAQLRWGQPARPRGPRSPRGPRGPRRTVPDAAQGGPLVADHPDQGLAEADQER